MDGDSDRAALIALLDELRAAAASALLVGSPLAQPLDDCRVDAEQRLARAPDDPAARSLAALVLRCQLTLRAWRRTAGLGQPAARRCPFCDGALVELTRPGRVVPFRGRAIELPPDFAIPTCARCGAESLDQERALALDELLFSAYLLRRDD